MPEKEHAGFSVIVLILANLVPIAGVLTMGWQVFPIMLLFWFENVMIGFFNVLKILTCRGKEPSEPSALKLFYLFFFMFHYGMFTMGHGFFVIMLFGRKAVSGIEFLGVGPLVRAIVEQKLPAAALGLFLSHGFSFYTHYWKKEEYLTATPRQLMLEPYRRVILLHAGLIFGGFAVAFLGSSTWALLVFILLKILLDIPFHLREHRMKTSSAPVKDRFFKKKTPLK